ncbi:putative serine/threonine-protein kinase isoform X1 [Pistacia vera]|uniref:putative serine/threonine-protein kinase isoform X1 n=1 Tax=Pistacia vera TaxID=55513 RepID=UPI0012630657|nr:putative serine/threonine-protein kinase isoform X1 [Pistacia vera]
MKFLFCCTSSFSSVSQIETAIDGGQNHQNFHVFSSNELKTATHGFSSSNKIGEGGFGSVYKGRLQDGTFVAVKVLSIELESMRGEREFISELAALSDIKHENLVKLIGCCIDGTSRYLVYDYMENNSLTHSLLGGEQNRMKFSWEIRRDISLGVARGLAYLHEEIEPHIVHRDIKASNILIDQNFKPKVSDFGLSRLLRDNSSHISTRVAGTLGYLAPEYAISGHLTRKSDVYSFGVLLLEIISGRQVVVFDLEQGEHYLVQKAWEVYNAGNLVKLVDPTLQMNYPEEEAFRFFKVGLLCVQENVRLRPTMSEALKMLCNEMDIQDVQISRPGLVADLMDIKLSQKIMSHSISSSGTGSIPNSTSF